MEELKKFLEEKNTKFTNFLIDNFGERVYFYIVDGIVQYSIIENTETIAYFDVDRHPRIDDICFI